MQLRELWRGKHNEVHGVRVGDELEIRTTTHGRTRITRIIVEPDGVKVIDTLPDGMRAEMSLARQPEIA
jgi:hypothetical protein